MEVVNGNTSFYYSFYAESFSGDDFDCDRAFRIVYHRNPRRLGLLIPMRRHLILARQIDPELETVQ